MSSPSPLRNALSPVRLLAALEASVLVAMSALALLAAPAQALPLDVYFNGTRPAADPATAYGISAASALNARDNFGITIIDSGLVISTITNKVSVISQNLTSVTPNPPTSALNRATSNWQIQNVSGSALTGANYLLFTHTDPYNVGATSINYPDESVGVRIDRDLGWVIIKARSGGIDYYYPALLLDRAAANPQNGNIAAGGQVGATIHYVVSQSLILAGGNYRLPEYQLGFAQVIPEPGTAVLFGFGLALLAAGRKQDAAR